MRKLVYMQDAECEEAKAKLGGYNSFPPNMVEIDFETYMGQLDSYTPDIVDYRQALPPDDKNGRSALVPCHLSIYKHDWSGLMYTTQYKNGGETVRRYYKFGVCIHNMVPVPEKSRMCYHVSRCTKCGHENAVDSSD